MATIIDFYEQKVREIALLQCRCETGADLVTVTDRPRQADEDPDTPDAA